MRFKTEIEVVAACDYDLLREESQKTQRELAQRLADREQVLDQRDGECARLHDKIEALRNELAALKESARLIGDRYDEQEAKLRTAGDIIADLKAENEELRMRLGGGALGAA